MREARTSIAGSIHRLPCDIQEKWDRRFTELKSFARSSGDRASASFGRDIQSSSASTSRRAPVRGSSRPTSGSHPGS